MPNRSLVRYQLSNDPTLSSLPLLVTFLKSYSSVFLGIKAPNADVNGDLGDENIVPKDIKDRFRKMCEGYFETVCKKLVQEHNVNISSKQSRLVVSSRTTETARTRKKESRGLYPLW